MSKQQFSLERVIAAVARSFSSGRGERFTHSPLR